MKHPKLLCSALFAALAVMALGGASSASATTLSVGGVTQNKSVGITMTLASGTSTTIKDEFGTTTDSCLTSEGKGSTESPFSSGVIWMRWVTWIMINCTHTTHIISGGSLHIAWTSGSNGTLSISGSEWTIFSTFFGATATCKTGSGTKVGTLTGVSSGKATAHINAKINCGILGSSSWTGTYTVTSPEGLGVAS